MEISPGDRIKTLLLGLALAGLVGGAVLHLAGLAGRIDDAADRMRQHVGASRYRLPPGFSGTLPG